MVAAYGAAMWGGGRPDYDTWVQLWLNLSRLDACQAWNVKTGIELALSHDAVDPNLLAELADNEADACELIYQTNASRTRTRKLAEADWED